MKTSERLEQKKILLDDQGLKIRENVETSHRLERELKKIQKALESGTLVDLDDLKKQTAAIAEEMKTLGQRLQDIDLLKETPFEVPCEDKRFELTG